MQDLRDSCSLLGLHDPADMEDVRRAFVAIQRAWSPLTRSDSLEVRHLARHMLEQANEAYYNILAAAQRYNQDGWNEKTGIYQLFPGGNVVNLLKTRDLVISRGVVRSAERVETQTRSGATGRLRGKSIGPRLPNWALAMIASALVSVAAPRRAKYAEALSTHVAQSSELTASPLVAPPSASFGVMAEDPTSEQQPEALGPRAPATALAYNDIVSMVYANDTDIRVCISYLPKNWPHQSLGLDLQISLAGRVEHLDIVGTPTVPYQVEKCLRVAVLELTFPSQPLPGLRAVVPVRTILSEAP